MHLLRDEGGRKALAQRSAGQARLPNGQDLLVWRPSTTVSRRSLWNGHIVPSFEFANVGRYQKNLQGEG